MIDDVFCIDHWHGMTKNAENERSSSGAETSKASAEQFSQTYTITI
jgi:hypothetical protein